jgi:CAAX prenyl protease-like protein
MAISEQQVSTFPVTNDTGQSSSAPYVIPFAVFMAFLAVNGYLEFLGTWEFPLRVAVLGAVLWVFSRHVIDYRVTHLGGTILMGVGVYVLWVAPDLLFPGYRHHWIFQNALMGQVSSSIPDAIRTDSMVIVFRLLRAVVLVPIIEELFWRAWLMRWLVNPDFAKLPLGAFTASSMILTAALFASEHGPFWDVGLVTGFLYNWWMVKTKSLGDCILAHAITNGCLSAYVLLSGKWEYWL